MKEFKLTIISPEGLIKEGRVSSLVAPGVFGSFGVLADHAPMMVALARGVLQIKDTDGEHFYRIDPGVLEISVRNEVIALVDQAVRFDTLEQAKENLQRDQLNPSS